MTPSTVIVTNSSTRVNPELDPLGEIPRRSGPEAGGFRLVMEWWGMGSV